MLNAEQKKALNTMLSGKNVFLTGEGGTGKSFVINTFLQHPKTMQKNVLVCAPTGIAAENVGGATLHHTFGAPIQPIGPLDLAVDPGEEIINADVLLIDEISMVRFDLLEYCIKTLKKAEEIRNKKIYAELKKECVREKLEEEFKKRKKTKQIIVVGDFYQLPPVLTPDAKNALTNAWQTVYGTDFATGDGFAFIAPAWAECDFTICQLHEIVRQKGDAEFIKALNKARMGDITCLDWLQKNTAKRQVKGITVCAKKKAAADINTAETSRLPGKIHTFTMQKSQTLDTGDLAVETKIELKKGMRVMSALNDPSGKGRYQNGSLGEITGFAEGDVSVFVKWDTSGEECEITKNTWEVPKYSWNPVAKKIEKIIIGTYTQIPLKVAYAITIHKAQGQTFARVNVEPYAFAPGQLYVALSRAESAKGLRIAGKINPKWLFASQQVTDFFAGKLPVYKPAMPFPEPGPVPEQPQKPEETEKLLRENKELKNKIAELEEKIQQLQGKNPRNAGRKSIISPELIKAVKKYKKQGLSTRKIAEKVGVSASTVQNILKSK